MRGLLVACALVLAATAGTLTDAPARTSCHPEGPGSPTQRIHHGNLDRDADIERVVETFGGCPHQSEIALADRCGGRTRLYRVPGSGFRARLDLVEANGRTESPELLFGLRPGKPIGRYRGNAGLVNLAAPAAGRCPRPVYLLSYFLRPPPPRAGRLIHLEVLRSGRREVRVLESFASARFRETRFRYVRRTNRYVITKA